MKNFLIAVIITLLIYLLWNYIENYKVVSEVVDGDTFKINGKSVRLIGIDAPEIGEPCYLDAKEKLKELIKDKIVRLEKDFKERDEYGRLLRYVYVDGLFVNAEMIRLGLAKFEEIEPNIKYSDLFLNLESKARKAKRCIWDNHM
ncbi:MAG: thermonuclease family protein [Candidatus Aenigmatarchaeota archaeon]